MKKTQKDAILAALKGRKKPLTALDISDKTGIEVNSTRVVLSGLLNEGDIVLAGTQSSAIGRPSNLYLLP